MDVGWIAAYLILLINKFAVVKMIFYYWIIRVGLIMLSSQILFFMYLSSLGHITSTKCEDKLSYKKLL